MTIIALPPSVLLASACGNFFNALFIGGNVALSFIAPSAILRSKQDESNKKASDKRSPSPTSNSHLIRQWFYLFCAGTRTMPVLFVVASLNYGYCFLRTWNLIYIVSILVCLGIVPYTYLVMGALNGELLKRSRALGIKGMQAFSKVGMEHMERPETGLGHVRDEDLIAKWGRLSGMRLFFSLGGIVTTAIVHIQSMEELPV